MSFLYYNLQYKLKYISEQKVVLKWKIKAFCTNKIKMEGSNFIKELNKLLLKLTHSQETFQFQQINIFQWENIQLEIFDELYQKYSEDWAFDIYLLKNIHYSFQWLHEEEKWLTLIYMSLYLDVMCPLLWYLCTTTYNIYWVYNKMHLLVILYHVDTFVNI